MSYRQIHNNLHLACLTAEQRAKTCGYWFTVTNNHCAHTAFARKESLEQWALERGLKLPEMPAALGTHAWGKIEGSYADEAHMSYDELYALPDVIQDTRKLSNGSYTLGRITQDGDTRVVHYLNPNLHYRQKFDYAESQALFG